jgi:hypothetical protein
VSDSTTSQVSDSTISQVSDSSPRYICHLQYHGRENTLNSFVLAPNFLSPSGLGSGNILTPVGHNQLSLLVLENNTISLKDAMLNIIEGGMITVLNVAFNLG